MPLDNKIRILNFDKSLLEQKELLAKFNASITWFDDIGASARYWISKQDLNKIRAGLKGEDKNKITFIGSGDYHHVSFPLIEKFKQPLSVIIFDNHPDWDTFSMRLNCGSWVNNVLRLPNVKKVISIGASSHDLDNLITANISALNSGRLELYPFRDKPSRRFFRKIFWRNPENEDWEKFVSEIIQNLPTDETYISIDKDCLTEADAVTNWEPGRMGLGKLLTAIKAFKEKKDIIGLDICGEYSNLPKPSGLLKPWFSKTDHPKDMPAQATPQKAQIVNQNTNIAILQTIL